MIRKSFVSVAMLLLLTKSAFAQFAVLDMANLVNSIEQLYQTYQQITHAIEQVQNTYQQIEQAAKQVMSMDWDNLSNLGENFAGMSENPFEVITGVRNSTQDIVKEVNKKMNDWNRLSDMLTDETIKFGGMSVSVADLVGAGDPDKDATSFMDNAWTYVSKTGERMAEGYTGKLTPEQKRAIMKEYGMSPRNYAQLQFANYQLDKMVRESNVMGTFEALRDTTEKQIASANALKVMIQSTPEGSLKSSMEVAAMIEVEALLATQDVANNLQRYLSMYSQHLTAEKAKEYQQRLEEMREAEEAEVKTLLSRMGFDPNL